MALSINVIDAYKNESKGKNYLSDGQEQNTGQYVEYQMTTYL